MPATLLVLDIDGTLRPHGEPRVPKENVEALRTVQKAGVKLVIATGRCRAEIPAKMLRGIRPDYWICAAGAQVAMIPDIIPYSEALLPYCDYVADTMTDILPLLG